MNFILVLRRHPFFYKNSEEFENYYVKGFSYFAK